MFSTSAQFLKWPRAAGPFLAAAKLEIRPLVVPIYHDLSCRQGLCLLVFLWACGQRASVVHMSTGSCRHALSPDGHRGAIAERLMKAALIVQQGLRTPTELSFGNCCTRGIHGLVFGSAFMKLSRSRKTLFFAVV